MPGQKRKAKLGKESAKLTKEEASCFTAHIKQSNYWTAMHVRTRNWQREESTAKNQELVRSTYWRMDQEDLGYWEEEWKDSYLNEAVVELYTKNASSLTNILLENFLEFIFYDGFNFRATSFVEIPWETIHYRRSLLCFNGSKARSNQNTRDQKERKDSSHGWCVLCRVSSTEMVFIYSQYLGYLFYFLIILMGKIDLWIVEKLEMY